ncbi:hypothetical protein AMELA_G00196800, partial [Ameiurus melas]
TERNADLRVVRFPQKRALTASPAPARIQVSRYYRIVWFAALRWRRHVAVLVSEAALVLYNDSGPFSAAPAMDANRKNYRCGKPPFIVGKYAASQFYYYPT